MQQLRQCQQVTQLLAQQGSHRLHFALAVHSRHPFPPIGDAAYRQLAGGGPSGHREHAQKLVKIAHAAPKISSWTDRHTQTDRHRHNTSQPQ